MARGVEGKEALDMSKFFDTNYHYMVPELDDSSSAKPDFKPFLEKVSLKYSACSSTLGLLYVGSRMPAMKSGL